MNKLDSAVRGLEWLLLDQDPQALEPADRAKRAKLRELARGLTDSEYWELINVVVLGSLETAKASLENPSSDLDRIRFCQGQASVLRETYNFLLELARDESEEGKNVG
jgi:hypothetical protein